MASPGHSRARKIEIKCPKTALPPIRLASQYESINASPIRFICQRSGLSARHLVHDGRSRTGGFSKGSQPPVTQTRVDTSSGNERTRPRGSISSRAKEIAVKLETREINSFIAVARERNSPSPTFPCLPVSTASISLPVYGRFYIGMNLFINEKAARRSGRPGGSTAIREIYERFMPP